MADLIVPKLGESISEAVIAKWLKQVGEATAIDEPVVDLETDKVSVTLPAPAAGVLSEQRAPAGTTVRVGEVIGIIATDGAAVTKKPAKATAGKPVAAVAAVPAPASASASAAPRPFAPAASSPAASVGSAASAQVAAAPAASASAASAPAASNGSASAASAPAASAPAVSKPAASAPASPAAGGGAISQPAADPHAAGRTLPPSLRRAIREHEGEVQTNGSATAPQLVAAVPQIAPAMPQIAPAVPQIAPAPGSPVSTAADDDEEVVRMSPLRKTIAERLVAAQHTAAILTTFNEIDMTGIMALRSRHQDAFVARHGIKLGYMSFFTRAVIAGLRDFPGLNAEMRADAPGGPAIIYKKHYDIGIAVGGGRGLVVPVVKHADRLAFADLEKTIADLGQRARDGKLALDDLAGGTFTITNGGIYGSMLSTPLINLPQTGILGMHNIIKRPVAVGDAIELRPMMYVALSYDHRVVDGREAVQFLAGVKHRLEAPEMLLLAL